MSTLQWVVLLASIPIAVLANLVTPIVARLLGMWSSVFARRRELAVAANQQFAATLDDAPHALIAYVALRAAFLAAFMVNSYMLLAVGFFLSEREGSPWPGWSAIALATLLMYAAMGNALDLRRLRRHLADRALARAASNL
jgi:hypothetical protein